MSSKNAHENVYKIYTAAAVPQQVKVITSMLTNGSDYTDPRYFDLDGKLKVGPAIQGIAILSAAKVLDNNKKTDIFNTFTNLVLESVSQENFPAIQEQIEGSREYMKATL